MTSHSGDPPGANSPRPIALASHARLLVIRLGDMGDALLAAPMLRALRARYPFARIDALTSPVAAALLAESSLLDHIIAVDVGTNPTNGPHVGVAPRFSALADIALRLRRARYDAAILARHLTLPSGRRQSRALLAAIGAPITVGLDNGTGTFLTLRVPDAGFGARHEAEYALALAAALDAPLMPEQRAPTLADLGWSDVGRAQQAARDAIQIALHAGSGAYSIARRWPADRYAQLARALRMEFNATIILVGGAEEHALNEEICAALDHPSWIVNTAGMLTLRRLAETLAGAHLFIGNDSLPMHLAAAAATPVVALFGPTNARAWGPYVPHAPENAVVIRRTDLPCSPCVYRGHELGAPAGCPPRPCLTELEIGPALLAARRLLRNRLAAPPA